jgi:cell wall-associated NlpC family hydrolase
MKFDVERFVADARDLAKRKVPFRDQGKNPDTGLDCIGLPRYLYRLQGLELPEEMEEAYRSYHPVTDGQLMRALLDKYLISIPVIVEAALGDLLLFRTKRYSRHMAIKVELDPVWVVEAQETVVVDWPLDPWRARLVVAAYRIPETL